MRLITYSFAGNARNSQKSNLAKLLKNREQKGLLRRLGRGKIEVREDAAEEVIRLIKKYNGKIVKIMRTSTSTDSLTERITDLENNLALIKEKMRKDSEPESNKRLNKLEEELALLKNAMSEIESPDRSSMQNSDKELSKEVASLEKRITNIESKISDLDVQIGAIKSLIERLSYL